MQPPRQSGRNEPPGADPATPPDRAAAASTPGGTTGTSRKTSAAIRALAREHAATAVKALVAVMTDAKATPAARVSAASTLLNWGYGKGSTTDAGAAGRGATEQVVRLIWGGDAKS